MNDFEQALIDKVLNSVHSLEVKLTEVVGLLRADIRENRAEAHSERAALREMVQSNIEQDTRRLNSHSDDLDNHRERLARIEQWQTQYEKRSTTRLLISQSVTTIVAVVLAYLLSKM